ncbi:methylated-DNA--[protein]-cysteine S-methyltransferase [Rhodocyclus tenuis]|uniref:Methylated-DNA--[protein]-cysteine S-methyltransferase n=1 Tax=Rhodocyclus gracilis TaxID=2929842 RepID=A0ABX0WF66_9RHOO|nr:methylated-DNA--[protein]-cysteine S-methyltransferase [Rhodocyclus gracilis]NJA88277.1 methylated-DNA--[protein]-cysteine S-methyltransferase [Rhodocyclus gracilis]
MPHAPLPFHAIVPAEGFWLGLRCEQLPDADGQPGRPALVGVHFLDAPRAYVTAPAACADLAAESARQLKAWLADPRVRFDLPLAPRGTPFQHRVWATIAAIPRGDTRTYGAIAGELHSAARAVGQACGANPLPIIVPCHRVIAANGGLGGFARAEGGFLLDVKRWLLQHERQG